jgi:tRNA-splicing endonuclease subunit Sen34
METEVDSKLPYIAITPTTSDDLIWKPICEALSSAGPKPNSLLRHLQGSGYYMMPGLRFGASFSVYPGDPLRFHAHFLANHCGWDEDIPMLDIVGSARLGTSVKKGFLIGGEAPETTSGRKQVRAFTLEWAGM